MPEKNNINSQILAAFLSKQNLDELYNKHGDSGFYDDLDDFLSAIQIELQDSDPAQGMSLQDHVEALNERFLLRQTMFVTDGQPAGILRDDTQASRADYCENAAGFYLYNVDDAGMNVHEKLFWEPLARFNCDRTVAIGVSTPKSDARLFSRHVFRKNEAGVENGIPRREARLYRRRIERNIDEALSATEYGYSVRKHDMSDLYARVDKKQARRLKRDQI